MKLPTASPVIPKLQVQPLVNRLLQSGVIAAEAWDAIPAADRDTISSLKDTGPLLQQLTDRRLITPHQAEHIRDTRSPLGLILGNYRLLERIGSNGVDVYRAEHRRLRTPAVVKTLVRGTEDRAITDRFYDEIRVLQSLKHPSIVTVQDAGEEPAAGRGGAPMPYLVLDPMTGHTLADWVATNGPLPVARACQVIHQIADALAETHRLGLFHRRITPSCVFVTPDGRAKLLDFGASWLAPPCDDAKGYTAPELARDPHLADARVDVYSLAVTLLFAITGRSPFDNSTNPGVIAEPIPNELALIINKMTAPDPNDRMPSASQVSRELTPFLSCSEIRPESVISELESTAVDPAPRKPVSILIVDDEFHVRQVVKLALAKHSFAIDEVADGVEALARLASKPYDLVMLDMELPKMNGEEVLQRLRDNPATPHLKIIVLSGKGDGDFLSNTLLAGADDFLAKPFSVVQLRARVTAALRLKEAQDQSDVLAQRLATSNTELELALNARDGELIHARGALVLALARLVEQRSSETGPHLLRLQRYCRVLGEAAAATPRFAGRLTPELLQLIEQAAPLHDIGKVAIPDAILNKPGKHTNEERLVMQSHAAAGADTLAGVAKQYPFATAFFHTAVEIARHHHERWDGCGYPSRLAGEAIPLSARLLALGDVYDALRARRVYKAGFDHATAMKIMLTESPGHFDPHLLEVFKGIHEQFAAVFSETAE